MDTTLRFSCILLVLTMGLSGCFSAPLPADAAAPPLPPLSQTGIGTSHNNSSEASETEPDRPLICTMVSAREEAEQEREYRAPDPEPGVISSGQGPNPSAGKVVVDVGDEDWIRLQIQAPQHVSDEDRDEHFRQYKAFKAMLDFEESDDGEMRVIEGDTKIGNDTFTGIGEEGLIIEFKVRAIESGTATFYSLRHNQDAHYDDGSTQTFDWSLCDSVGSDTAITYHVNPES